jgi:hypothetical protein
MKYCDRELKHSVWDWLFEAVEVIVDRNNASLLCQDFSQSKPKQGKTSLMLKLFNDKYVHCQSAFLTLRPFQNYNHVESRTSVESVQELVEL